MTTPRRILLVIRADGIGGSERTMAHVIAVLDQHEVAWDLVALQAPRFTSGPLADHRPRVLDVRGRTNVGRRLGQLRWLRRAMSGGTYDGVLAFGPTPGALVALARRRGGPRVVVSERGDPYAPRRRAWNRRNLWAFRRADAVVVATELLAEDLRRDRRYPDEVRVVPNALDPAVPLVERRRERTRTIVGVGRLAPVKRFGDLVEAFAAIADEVPDWDLVLVGDGEERASLEALITDLDLHGRVRLTGWHPAPWEVLADSDLLVLSSAHEGFAHVLLEAMASGCCVVASDCRVGPREQIDHGVDGLRYPTGDVGVLADLLRELIADPARRDRLAEAGGAKAGRSTLEAVAPCWLDALGLPAGAGT